MASATSSCVPADPSRNGTCCICLRPVYAMEAIIAEFKFYHKACFRCAQCHRTLSVMNYDTHNGWIYCNAHMPKTTPVVGRRSSDNLSPTNPRSPTGHPSTFPKHQHHNFPPSGTLSPLGIKRHNSETETECSSPLSPDRTWSERSFGPSSSRFHSSGSSRPQMNPQTFQLPPFPGGMNCGSSVSERVRAFSNEKTSAGKDPKPDRRDIDDKHSVSGSSLRRTQSEVRKDRQRGGHTERMSGLDTISPSPPTTTVPEDGTMDFEGPYGRGHLASLKQRAPGQGLWVNTGGSHRRAFSVEQTSTHHYPANARRPSTGSDQYRSLLHPSASYESLRSTQRSANSSHSDLENLGVGEAKDKSRLTINKWRSEPGVQLTEQERLHALRKKSPRVSSGDGSIQSLLNLSVNALTQMESDPFESNGDLKEKKGHRLSLSLEALTKKKRTSSLQQLLLGAGPTNSLSIESISSVSSTHTISILAELAHIVSTQGSDLISLYESVGRSRSRRSVGPSSIDVSNAGRHAHTEISITVFRGIMDSVRKITELASPLVSTKELKSYSMALAVKEREAEKEVTSNGMCPSIDSLRQAIQDTVWAAQSVVTQYTATQKKLYITSAEGYRLEAFGDPDTSPIIPSSNQPVNNIYSSYPLEHIGGDADYYRKHFHGHDHRTFIGDHSKLGPVIISLMYRPNEPRKGDSQAAGGVGSAGGGGEKEKESGGDAEFWAIMRTKEAFDLRAVIQASQVSGHGVLRNKPDARAVLQMLHKDLQAHKLRKVSDPSIEKKLMVLDELQLITRYKFGALYCKGNQSTEEEYFSNETGSQAFEEFLSCLGDKVELQGWQGYAAGLDTKHGQTGKHSLFTKWRNFDIMFHVSTYLPYKKEDKQQIQRKRHIGNDIVTIIFLEGDGKFNPKSVKSQFLHVFIVVREDRVTRPGEVGYRIALASNVDVPPFAPPLPTPPVFWDKAELRDFLLAKMVNAENAAYKAPKFKTPHHRTRNAVIDEIIRDYWSISKGRGDRRRNEDKNGASARSSVGSVSSDASTIVLQQQHGGTPRGSEAGPHRRGSLFTGIGGFARRGSTVETDGSSGLPVPSSRKGSIPDLLVEECPAPSPSNLAHSKLYGGSMDALAEPKKKKGFRKLARSKSTKLDTEAKIRSRSTNALSSAESIPEVAGEDTGKRKTPNHGLLSAFNLKRKSQEEKNKSRSMDTVESLRGNTIEGRRESLTGLMSSRTTKQDV
ncbi:uncharacterized protein SPPG_06762 [Spizellomyces punctatus DAOM BR117]|uniref:Rap-GAP domain-containing protein n=1 Tax=Spizellomyces punctatus (strain DAOM BR117) TaxID=645134 RepID=A0A0L0H988_SPIPD|nr:uncharacterized protein SPPG_06762 [Spizellomyces punctatus DAOM BR117]KNC97762.1 hypothetical protein SPPG_06762 [Spizellomyces punctatus DAOM BR117]|eukprot:XP_016605802.1 hypothetical protein SPPG_06762 [Spizellomyces punctatus DAOM BR117]